MKLYDCSSLLVISAHHVSFFAIFSLSGVSKIRKKWRKMRSGEQEWRAMTRNQIVSLTTMPLWSNKRDPNQKHHLSWENERISHFFDEFSTVFRQKRRQIRQFRSFSQLRQYFWFKSFLLAQKYIVVYGNIWLLVIARHCCSLQFISWIFLDFSDQLKMAKNKQ